MQSYLSHELTKKRFFYEHGMFFSIYELIRYFISIYFVIFHVFPKKERYLKEKMKKVLLG